jgi:hypothetical protein
MRDIKNKLTSGKNSTNIQPRKGKSFGYQVLGFGSGGSSFAGIEATGGTITEDGDFKVHTFTGPGTFQITAMGDDTNTVDYMVVAGGAAGGVGTGSSYTAGGGGAGGFRFSFPNAIDAGMPVSATSYPVTIGAGGTNPGGDDAQGSPGNPSVFNGITSTAGGGGGSGPNEPSGPGESGFAGGSGGGGGGRIGSGGAGNTPPVSPAQGFAGGPSDIPGGGAPYVGRNAGAGGGGATSVGVTNNQSPDQAGKVLAIAGAAPVRTNWAGGGAGSQANGTTNSVPALQGVPYGGGQGVPNSNPSRNGVANTGGGGSGGYPVTLGTGGSGIVVIRYQFK